MEGKRNVYMCCFTDAYCLHRMRNENHTELQTLVTQPKRKCRDQEMVAGKREREREGTKETDRRKATTTILIIPSTNV